MAEALTHDRILELFKETDRRIDRISDTLGTFVEGLVQPKVPELFRERGIEVSEIHHNIQIKKTGLQVAEIDLLLVNAEYSVAVEVKTTLKVQHVDGHLQRLDRLKDNPIRTIKGTTLLGAIAGMSVAEGADKYACRKGLYVLRQKGEIMEIVNDEGFRPQEWQTQ